jgi:putative drug exporter of the RND superfamily
MRLRCVFAVAGLITSRSAISRRVTLGERRVSPPATGEPRRAGHYEIFLVSRTHEEWERGRDASRAIGRGLATTGRVITAAGAIMIVVFGAFLFAPERMLQQFGLGLAVAILLDAFVIRCLIVPAAMQLLGDRAWWLPRWLGRALPRVALERA